MRRFHAGSARLEHAVEIYHGETIVDRKSKFEAHLAMVTSQEQVDWVFRALLQDKKIARASHNVVSWRYVFTRRVIVSYRTYAHTRAHARRTFVGLACTQE